METKPRTLLNNALTFGLLTAFGSIAFSVITYVMEVPYKSPLMYLSFVILLAGMIYGTIQHRDKDMGGYISFGKAFLSAYLIVLVSAIFTALYSYIFFTFIDPAYLQKIIEQALEKAQTDMAAKGLAEDQMEPALNITRKMMSPVLLTVFSFLGSALFGAILALITGAIIKKEDKSFDGQFKNIE